MKKNLLFHTVALMLCFIFSTESKAKSSTDNPPSKKKIKKDSLAVFKEKAINIKALSESSSHSVEMSAANECVSYNIVSSKKTYTVDETVNLTIVLKLYDLVPTAIVDEECSKFSINVALPASFKQTGGDYQNYMNVNLSKGKPEATFSLVGQFTKKDSLGCFVLMKGPTNANSSTIFIKKKEYCIEAVNAIINTPTNNTPIVNKTPTSVATATASPCVVSQMVDRDVICEGETIILTAPNCTGSATWRKRQYDLNNNYVSGSLADITSPTNELSQTLTTSGYYDYDAPTCASGQSSCPSGGFLRVTVKAGSPATVTPPSLSPNSICSSNTMLTASNCTGTVHWYRVGGLGVNSNIQLNQGPVGVNTWTTSGNDYVFSKCEIGCSLSDESNRVYNSSGNTPTITASSTSYCTNGTSVTLTATGCLPWETITWNNGYIGNIIGVAPQTTSSYSAKCNQYDLNGLLICENPNSSNGITITVNTASVSTPTISPAIKNVCASEVSLPTTISASGCSSYLWSTGEVASSITVYPTETTIYTVRCGSVSGCLGSPVSSTINVIYSPVPTTPTISSSIPLSGNNLINCTNQPFTLTGGNCNGTLDWYWRPHNNGAAYTYISSGPSLTVTNSTHVVYTVACRTECRSGSIYGTYIVLYPPEGIITASSNSPLLLGQTLSLSSSASNATYSSTTTYSWTGPNAFNSAQQNASVSSVVAASAGVYTITITNGQCPSTATTSVIIDGCVSGASITTTNPIANPSIAYTDKNNIVENIYLKPTSAIPTTNFEVAQSISYIDGFGRIAQVVNTGSSPTGKDVILPIEYDAFGRMTKSYLPYAASSSSNGSYKSTAIADQASFYTALKADSKAYAETILESSPMQILKQQGFVGTSWQPNTTTPANAKAIKADFKHNTETTIRKFWYDYTAATWKIGTYGANELMVSETKDIDNNIIEEFTDFAGNTVLKRVSNPAKTSSILTYQAYDGFNRLAFTFPPLASANLTTAITPNGNINPNTNTNLLNLLFAYTYDKRGRLISTKAPDAGLQEVVYDPLDRPVLQRDALNASATTPYGIPIWKYTRYDELGRIHSSGIIGSSNTRATMQTNCDSYYASTMFYGNSGYPNTATTEYIRNYYDSYSNFIQPFTNGTVYSVPKSRNLVASNNVNGKLVGISESVLFPIGANTANTKAKLTTAYYYDNLGRMVQTIADDQNSKLVVSTQTLDFADRIETIEQEVGVALATNYTTKVTISQKYDQGSRLKLLCQQINTDPIENIGKYTYNEIGELSSKIQGCDIQTIGYKFDIQGKLTDINEVNTTNLSTQKRFFGEKLTYNLNGSINKIEWGTIPTPNAPAAQLPPTRSFTYTYDYLYRMTAAAYVGKAGENFSTTNTYDVNGNISTLTRRRGTITEDNLTYTYTTRTNILVKVADANTTANATGWFKDGTNTGNDYTYDAAGNIKTDLNKGITNIDYNYLNLPERISFNNATFVRYIYTASGEKIRKENHDGVKTDYIGGMVYKNNILEFIATAEGRAIPDAATFRYEYQISDHLGNLRSTYYKNKTAPVGTEQLTLLQENHYDPWGLNLTDIEKAYTNADRYQYNAQTEKATLPNGSYDYDTDFRQYDPQTGRFKTIDPLADFYGSISPFSFGYNNPVSFNDPLGLFPLGVSPGRGGGPLPGSGQGFGVLKNSLTSAGVSAGINIGVNLASNAINNGNKSNFNSTVKNAGSSKSSGSMNGGGSSKISSKGGRIPDIPKLNYSDDGDYEMISDAGPNDAEIMINSMVNLANGTKDIINAVAHPVDTYNSAKKFLGESYNAAKSGINDLRNSSATDILTSNVSNDPRKAEGGLTVAMSVSMMIRTSAPFDPVKAFKNAISSHKPGQAVTNAGVAVTKHSNYFGFETTEALRQVYRSDKALNKLGADFLKNVLRNGVKTTGAGGRYPQGWVTYTLPNGNAASWHLDGRFIGFRGVQ